jgi:biopolymer transport protein ExbD
MKNRLSAQANLDFNDTFINLTPLIDVVFIVLIAFMLIAPLLEIDEVDLATTAAVSQKSIQNKTSISLYVKKDNTLWLNNRLIEEKDLITVLKQQRNKTHQNILKLFHDKNACFGTYQIVKNSAEAAGFERIDVILKPN